MVLKSFYDPEIKKKLEAEKKPNDGKMAYIKTYIINTGLHLGMVLKSFYNPETREKLEAEKKLESEKKLNDGKVARKYTR
jgi:hypothetical protein